MRYSATDIFLDRKFLQRSGCLSQTVGVARCLRGIELSGNCKNFRKDFEREIFK